MQKVVYLNHHHYNDDDHHQQYNDNYNIKHRICLIERISIYRRWEEDHFCFINFLYFVFK